jgi:hypothetical protein
MPPGDGSLTASERLNSIEDIHAQGGICEKHRTEIWEAINEMRAFQNKILGVVIVMSVIGPVVAEYILKIWK